MRKPTRPSQRRWEVSSEEWARITHLYDQPLTKRKLGRLVLHNPRLALEMLRAMAQGAADAISLGSSVFWAIDAERVREAVPDAASGVSWSGETTFRDELMKHVGPGDRVLDLGCGAGRFARHVATEAEEVICVDSSPTLLREARLQLGAHTNIRYVQNRGWTLAGIADGSVDLVFSQGIFGFVDPRSFVVFATEVRRVLRPGGTFLFSAYTFDRRHTGGWVREALEVTSHCGRVHSGIPEPFTVEFVLALLDLASFPPPNASEVPVDPRGYAIFPALSTSM